MVMIMIVKQMMVHNDEHVEYNRSLDNNLGPKHRSPSLYI